MIPYQLKKKFPDGTSGHKLIIIEQTIEYKPKFFKSKSFLDSKNKVYRKYEKTT